MEKMYQFIDDNITANPKELRLKYYAKKMDFDVDIAITQIESRQKARNKIPELLENKHFLFPNSIVAEQCTNEIIARYHSLLVAKGSNVLDITAGLCVDSYYIGKHSKVTAIEIDKFTAETGIQNMQMLGANVTVVNEDCVDYVKSCNEKYDIIFADPARRDSETGKKVSAFGNCSPNILSMLTDLRRLSRYLMIKSSPMVDISKGLHELGSVSEVWITGIGGECKELLFKLDFEQDTHPVKAHIVEFNNKGEMLWDYSYELPCHDTAELCSDIKTGEMIYEPSACVIKGGAANKIAGQYNLRKIHNNSHLYISENIHRDFPGRMMKIYRIEDYHSRNLKSIGKDYPRLNITTRNFPHTAEELRSKLKSKDGGDDYLFATTTGNEKPVLIFCQREVV
ncbi:MAG: hypothetical protein J1F10_08170 [Muribaculaceae bacterium]|nr:hypothetical protein [Muribaculaceae bacterium]